MATCVTHQPHIRRAMKNDFWIDGIMHIVCVFFQDSVIFAVCDITYTCRSRCKLRIDDQHGHCLIARDGNEGEKSQGQRRSTASARSSVRGLDIRLSVSVVTLVPRSDELPFGY